MLLSFMNTRGKKINKMRKKKIKRTLKNALYVNLRAIRYQRVARSGAAQFTHT